MTSVSGAKRRSRPPRREAGVLGIDVGGTNIRAGVIQLPRGSVVATHAVRTEAAGGKRHSLDRLSEAASGAVIAARARGIAVTGVGVAIAELVGLEGSIDSHETLSWRARDLHRVLEAYGAVTIESDVRAAALAEAKLGAGRGAVSMLYVTIGTGISCTLVIGGSPYAGAHGHAISFASGPAFPVEQDAPGASLESLELRAAGPGILRRARALGASDADTHSVCANAQAGPGPQRAAVDAAAAELALHLSVLANALDPAVIVIGGGLGSSPGYYWMQLRRQLRRRLWGPNARRLPICRAALGDTAGMIGAALSCLPRPRVRPLVD